MRFHWKTVFGLTVVLGVLTPSAHAFTMAYDSGRLGLPLNLPLHGVVRFSNPYSANFMDVEGVYVYGERGNLGLCDINIWNDSSGHPGSLVSSLSEQILKDPTGIGYWNYYDFSSAGISVAPEEDIFAGILSIDCGLPYDRDNTTTHRSWWSILPPTWVNGQLGALDQDLMVRLEYTQGVSKEVPEPATLAFFLVGLAAALLLRWRQRVCSQPL